LWVEKGVVRKSEKPYEEASFEESLNKVRMSETSEREKSRAASWSVGKKNNLLEGKLRFVRQEWGKELEGKKRSSQEGRKRTKKRENDVHMECRPSGVWRVRSGSVSAWSWPGNFKV